MLPGTSESGNNTGTSGLSTSSMKTGPIATTYSGWDFTTIWNRDAGMNDGYPHLRVPESTAPESLFTWNGSVSNDWNTPANWSSNAVPTSMVDVKIPNTVSNYPTLSAAGVCKNITIQSGASLLGNGYLTVSGTAMVDRAIPGASQAWHFLSSPVATQAISPAFTADPATSYDFFAWYEPTGEWVNFKNTTVSPTWETANVNFNFTKGKGYLIEYLGTGLAKTFTGSLNDGLVLGTLSKIGTGQLESFTSSTDITLEDVKLNSTQNLMQNPVYTFSSTKTDNVARFLLHFGEAFSIGENTKEQPVTVYASGNIIYIANNSGSVTKGDVTVYNMIGQPVMQQQLGENPLTSIAFSGATGYYLVKVVTGEHVYSGKIFIN